MKKITIVIVLLAAVSLFAGMPASAQEQGFGQRIMSQLPELARAAGKQESERMEGALWNSHGMSDSKPSRLAFNVWGGAYHPDDKKHQLNGFNPGLGLRYHFTLSLLGEEWFAQADYVFKNSVRKRAINGCIGAAYPFFEVGNVQLLGGIAACVIGYNRPVPPDKKNGKPETEKTIWGAAPIPIAMVRFNKASGERGPTLNIAFVPNDGKQSKLVAVLFFVSVPLPKDSP